MILVEHPEKQEAILLSRKTQNRPTSRQKAISFTDKLHLQGDRDNLGKDQNFVTMTHVQDTRVTRVKVTAGHLEHNVRDLKEHPRINKVVLLHALLVHHIMRTNNAPVVPKTALTTLLPLGNHESLECAKMVSLVSVASNKDATAISTYTKKILHGADLTRAQVMSRKESMESAWTVSPANAA
jgi:hypothetical protein